MKYVLFVCTHNAGRSQMARAFFERYAPADIRAESAGQQPRADGIWPDVLSAMQEVGIDLSDRRPMKPTVEMQLHADWAVTPACGASCPYVPTMVEDWDVADPAGLCLSEVREIRDDIEARVREFVTERLELVRTDRTAHQLRLERLLGPLVAEFGDEHPASEIRACTDAVLDRYDDVAVRSHVLTLAHRQTRECLQRDVCYELAEAR